MGQMKISEMQLAQQVNKEDYIPIVQGGANKKISAENLMDYNAMKNKPQINGKELSSENSLDYLEIQPKGNYVTKEEFNANDFATAAEVEKKLDKNLGKENSQKVLQISETGEVKAVEAIGGNNVVYKSEVAEPAIINDSFNKVNKGIEIYGQSKQASTTGINLLDYPKKRIVDSEYYDVDENGYVVQLKNDNRASNATPEIIKLPSGQYTASIESNDANEVYFQVYDLTNDKQLVIPNSKTNKSLGFNLSAECSIAFKIYKTDGTLGKARVQISKGSEIPSWEPYTGGKPSPNPDYSQEIISKEVSEIKVMGKNLFDSSLCESKNGLTVVHNEDGSITVTGTPTKAYAQIYAETLKIKKGTYTIKGGSTTTIYIQLHDEEKNRFYINKTFTLTDDVEIKCNIQSGANVSELNVTIYPILCFGTDGTFEPYKSQTITLSEPITLRGLPVASGGNVTIDGQQYIADVITEKDGVVGVERNLKEFIFDDTVDWQIYDNSNNPQYSGFLIYSQNVPEEIKGVPFRQNYCNIYPSVVGTYGNNLWITIETNQQHLWAPYNPFFDDLLEDKGLSNWKNYLKENPMKVVTYVNTPTFEPLPEEAQSQIRALQMYYPTTIVDCGAPVSVTYEASLQTIFEDLTSKINESINLSNKALLYNKD